MKKEIIFTGIVSSSGADLGVTKTTVDTLGFFFSYLSYPRYCPLLAAGAGVVVVAIGDIDAFVILLGLINTDTV